MHVFNYSYDEPAVNDPVHSAVVQQVLKDDWTCCRNNDRAYVEPFTKFRGHAMVGERRPDGRIRYTDAQVNGAAHDVAVDYAYDAYGRCTQETKPYLLAVWTQATGGTPYGCGAGSTSCSWPKTATPLKPSSFTITRQPG